MSLQARLRARMGRLTLEVEVDTGPGTLVIVGPNGAGKSSLLGLILGVRPVDAGRIEVGGAVLLDTATGIDVPTEQRRIGYVPQNYGLFPHLTALGNVAFALACAEPGRPRADRDALAHDLLTALGLAALAHRRPGTLSGGEQQRVALARALAGRPRALLLDEPLAALDIQHRRSVRIFLREWLQQTALPTIVITHDAAEARHLGDRIAVLEAGHITQEGTWATLATAPASDFVEALVRG